MIFSGFSFLTFSGLTFIGFSFLIFSFLTFSFLPFLLSISSVADCAFKAAVLGIPKPALLCGTLLTCACGCLACAEDWLTPLNLVICSLEVDSPGMLLLTSIPFALPTLPLGMIGDEVVTSLLVYSSLCVLFTAVLSTVASGSCASFPFLTFSGFTFLIFSGFSFLTFSGFTFIGFSFLIFSFLALIGFSFKFLLSLAEILFLSFSSSDNTSLGLLTFIGVCLTTSPL